MSKSNLCKLCPTVCRLSNYKNSFYYQYLELLEGKRWLFIYTPTIIGCGLTLFIDDFVPFFTGFGCAFVGNIYIELLGDEAEEKDRKCEKICTNKRD